MPFLALDSRSPHSVAPKHFNLEPGEGLTSLRSSCADAGQARGRGPMSLSAVTAPLARMEKRYLYLNRIYWPPQRRAFQLCPEASGQGLPLQQENSQRPQHGPTPFTASPNFIHSACPAQESCACQALGQRTQRVGHSSGRGHWFPGSSRRHQGTKPVQWFPVCLEDTCWVVSNNKAAPAHPGAFEVFKPRYFPQQIHGWPGNLGPGGQRGLVQATGQLGSPTRPHAFRLLSWNLASSDMPNCSRGSCMGG